jgi:hypothetical protein
MGTGMRGFMIYNHNGSIASLHKPGSPDLGLQRRPDIYSSSFSLVHSKNKFSYIKKKHFSMTHLSFSLFCKPVFINTNV